MKSSTVETLCANWLQCIQQHAKSGARCLNVLKMTKHRSNFTWISLIKIATKYIHFFNLLTTTKNEELEHNLPSHQTPHPMPHPPQPQSSTDIAKPEPSSKIGTVMKIRQRNQHSSSHTGTSKKVGYMWHHKQMQLETTHGSLHRPRVLAPLASNAHFSPLSPSAERSQNAYGDYLWTNGHPNHHHACHVPQSHDVPRTLSPTLKLRKNDSCPGTSTSILNFA